MKKKTIVAGHICLDITPMIPDRKTDHIGDILSPGKTVNAGAADIHTGGAVANTGLAMKILGADVSLAGKIGDDEFGDMIEKIMDGYGVSEGLIRSPGDHTSYSVVIAVPGLDRIFMHYPGANDTFCYDDLQTEEIKEAALFHFGYPSIMKKMYEDDGAELVRIMKNVKSMDAATSLDLSAVDPESESGKSDWERILSDTLPYVDIFAPSIEELMFMLCRSRYESISQNAREDDFTSHIDIKEDVIPQAQRCIDMGAKIVLIKCGARGMYYMTSEREGILKVGSKLGLDAAAWTQKSAFVPSFVPDRVLSATGAGDTAIAAFLTSILKGYGPADCAKYAAAAGALAVSEYDALSGLKSFEEIDRMIRNGWKQRGDDRC
ncbi:MAG: carbohydrate kinase family protein [Lachnospiraceae bacterium]|nr:carbohydrate kinase family protein [Lachnospiraceae bacterium]